MSKLGKLLKAKGLEGTHASGATRHYLDTGYPPLNEIISGSPLKGIPSGQLTMIAGPSACGKTMIATSLMISAQQHGGFAGMFDYETQYHEHLAIKQGLDVSDEDKYVYYKPKTFEEGIHKAIEVGKTIRENNIIDKDAPIVFVFDSIHAMTPKSKWDNLVEAKVNPDKVDKASMHDNYALSKASSDWFPIIQREFDAYGITGIFLNQVREKTVMVGPLATKKFTFPGGDAVFYYCSNVIVLTAVNMTDKLTRQFLGKKITAKTEKSRNTAPFQKVKYDFVIDKENETGNFDVLGSYVNHLLDIKAIETAGAWIKFQDKSFQGRDKVIDYFRTATDGLDQLKAIHEAHRARVSAEPEVETDDE